MSIIYANDVQFLTPHLHISIVTEYLDYFYAFTDAGKKTTFDFEDAIDYMTAHFVENNGVADCSKDTATNNAIDVFVANSKIMNRTGLIEENDLKELLTKSPTYKKITI